jgi:hypothetical protein
MDQSQKNVSKSISMSKRRRVPIGIEEEALYLLESIVVKADKVARFTIDDTFITQP